MRQFSEYYIGLKETITHQITQRDIDLFVELSGDDNKLHLDSDFARNTSFKIPVVHGMIGASFISTIIGTKLPGDGALWVSQSITFHLPVRINDLLTVSAEVSDITKSQRLLTLKIEIFNQYRQVVTSGTAKVKVLEQALTENQEQISPPTNTVLLLGATGGIGSEISRYLAQEGYSLFLHYHTNEAKAKALKNELEQNSNGKIELIKANLMNKEEIDEMFAYVSRFSTDIRGIVNSACLRFGNIKIKDLQWSDIQDQLSINVESSFNIVKRALPLFKNTKYGKIVFITSQSTESISKEWVHYNTAKFALNGLAKSFAVDLAHLGIRVNLVSPSMTETDFIADIPERTRMLTSSRTPLRRLASPKDIAGAVSYLISDKSDFVTGETIRINGGQVML